MNRVSFSEDEPGPAVEMTEVCSLYCQVVEALEDVHSVVGV